MNLKVAQVETLFGELEYIEPRLEALFADLPNTLLSEGRDGLSPSRIK